MNARPQDPGRGRPSHRNDASDVERAKSHLAALDAAGSASSAKPPASVSSATPPPPAPVAINPPKSAGGVTLPLPRARPLGLRDGTVVRIGLHHAGRTVPAADFLDRRYAGYEGQTPEGVKLGMPRDELVKRLGEPTQRFRPFGVASHGDGSLPFEVWDYPQKGLTVEIDLAGEGPFVGAIHVPKLGLVGKPVEATKKPGR